jgi:hypothetical protein
MKKTFSYSVFHWFFEITFYLFILMAVIVIGVEISRWAQNDHVASYSVGSILPDNVKDASAEKIEIKPRTKQVSNSYLTTSKWILNFKASDRSVKGYMAMMAIIKIGYIFIIFYTLRKFVLSLKNKEAFTVHNVQRLRILGLLLLLIEPLNWMGRYFSKKWISAHFIFDLPEESTAHGIGYKVGYAIGAGDFVWNWILAGLLILVISEVFKQGLQLKQENDLTV